MSSARFNSLLTLIKGCKKEEKSSQKLLYRDYYGFGMSIALRYCSNYEEAVEVLNDAFFKIFTKAIKLFDETEMGHEGAFKTWLKKIVINTAIDYFRKNKKHYYHENLDDINHDLFSIQPVITDTIAYEEMLTLIKRLSPAYRTVFCLYVIDGYSHEEIAKKLDISAGASKSNLAKARMRLKEMIKKEHKDEYSKYTG